MNCPTCNTPLYRGMKFCPGCASNVEDITSKPVCPSCKCEVSSDDTFCKHCGTNIKTGLTPSVKKQSYLWSGILIVAWFVSHLIINGAYQVLNAIQPEYETHIVISGVISCISSFLVLLPAIAVPHKVMRIVAIILAIILIIWGIISNIMMIARVF